MYYDGVLIYVFTFGQKKITALSKPVFKKVSNSENYWAVPLMKITRESNRIARYDEKDRTFSSAVFQLPKNILMEAGNVSFHKMLEILTFWVHSYLSFYTFLTLRW